VMDAESGDDDKDALTSKWGGESRQDCLGWRNESRYAPAPLLPVWAPRAAETTAAPAHGNVAAVSHAQYVPTLTAAAACA